ncbi:hypothetical protein GOODEAATRI_022493 [Goodea atripinnis]|uniref:Uncharacterized protein n=1 Tax=Goodea atripinnis TaxID=208336 RepID=A0ABV0PQT5_9TELE
MNGRFERRRKLLRLLESKPCFFSIGVTAAVLRAEGTTPVVREECIMSVIKGDKEGRVTLTRIVGRGSNWQVEDFDFLINLEMSLIELRVKTENKLVEAVETETDDIRATKGNSC